MSGYEESEEQFSSHFSNGFDILSTGPHEGHQHQEHETDPLEWQHGQANLNQNDNMRSVTTTSSLRDESGLVVDPNDGHNVMPSLEFDGSMPQEAASATNSNSNSNYEDDKRLSRPRRTRARGEALDILKKEFNANPSPTSQHRKKISEMTGLPEKNVRIWFQNRRAKYRKVGDRRDQLKGGGEAGSSSTLPFYSNSDCITFFDKIPLNINNNYYFIDICSITVGSWNRMKSGALRTENLEIIKDLSNLSPISINEIMSNATDLLVLISKKNFEINYFFSAMANNTKILFRIFFPINSVINCSLSLETDDIIESGNHSKEEEDEVNENGKENENGDEEISNKFAELKLTVSRPPNFAVYFLDASDEANKNQWSICEDFSEGRQVNDAFVGGSNIPHALKGFQSSLKFMNSLILDYNSTNQIIPPPPPVNAHEAVTIESQSLSLQPEPQPQAFFDHYDATNDMLNINKESPEMGEHIHQENNNTNLLSLPHENNISTMPDFFKNSTELTDDNRWL